MSHRTKFNPVPNYMRRSSEIIRLQVEVGLSGQPYPIDRGNLIGRGIRLAQYASVPSFRVMDYIRSNSPKYRIVGYGYYSECFYDNASKIAFDHDESAEIAQGDLVGRCGNAPGSMRPKFSRAREAIIMDISQSPRMGIVLSGLLEMVHYGGVFENVAADSTAKPTPH